MLKSWNGKKMSKKVREEWVESVVGSLQRDPFKRVDYVLCGDSLVISVKMDDQISVFDCKLRRLGRYSLDQNSESSD